jgi:CheY-like chemotaxis protein
MARILIIDDEEDIRTLLGDILKRDGHQTELFGDGQEVLKLNDLETYDLALVDLFMPGIDGLELIPKLNQMAPDLRIVAMSGGAATGQTGGLLRAAESFGAVASLAKPFRLAEVRELVSGLLS